MSSQRLNFLFLNLGHFLDHLFMLVFASVAALVLTDAWGMSYAQLIPYATPGFVAFGICSLPAGWIADRWSREYMIVVFFIGIGLSAITAAFTTGPLQMAASLTLVGVFAAIYHPVGLALVVEGRERTGMPLAINGVWGNLGVACAALFTGLLIDVAGWQSAFLVPGVLSVILGLLYLRLVRNGRPRERKSPGIANAGTAPAPALTARTVRRIFAIVFFTTALGGLVFQSTTFSLPRVLDERLAGYANGATSIGGYAFVVFSIAAMAQLVVGYLVDRHPVRRVFAVVALAQAALFSLMIFVDGLGSLLVAMAFMLFVFGQIPINDVLVGRVAKSEWRSRAFALRYIITFSVMATAVPLIAWIHGQWGFSHLFGLLAVAAGLIFIATLLLPAAAATVERSDAGEPQTQASPTPRGPAS